MTSIFRAVSRARTPIVALAAVYVVSVAVGMAMVHNQGMWALSYRDNLVSRAHMNDPAARADYEGRRVDAALNDFARNLILGAVPSTLTGLTIIAPYLFGAYRGWVGGIVSVDARHESRLRSWREGLYYLTALALQLVPYSLAGGIGVHLGISYFRTPAYDGGRRRWGYPMEALRDVLRVYALIVPLFLIASLWEFLSPLRR